MNVKAAAAVVGCAALSMVRKSLRAWKTLFSLTKLNECSQ
jgi:hypothetical protein